MSDQEYSEGEMNYLDDSISEEEQEYQEEEQQELQDEMKIITDEDHVVEITERITPCYLTKYEKARIIGARAV